MENSKIRKITAIAAAAAIAAGSASVYAMSKNGDYRMKGGLDLSSGQTEVSESGFSDAQDLQGGAAQGEVPEGSSSAQSQTPDFGGSASDARNGFSGKGARGGMNGGYGGQGGFGGMTQGSASYASEPTEIVLSELSSNSAEELTADYASAETITMSDENSSVKITKSGTYIVTGTCSDGNITVKKGTTGVVLVLRDLDLTSSTGATLSLNKGSEVKVIVEGSVSLTDAEDIADEESEDFDGAAIKAKAGSSVVLTGTGTLNVNGSCKHGIKVSGLDEDDLAEGYSDASFIVDGDLTINIESADDGMNSGSDLTIKSGTINVSAGDDGIKADYILTIGEEGGEGPTVNVTKSGEALEGAVVNIFGGDIKVNASDDGINAANSDLTDYTFSINITGGTVSVSAGADGLDSNGNINITGGKTTIAKSAMNGGDGGMDYQGSCYVADGCLDNPYGVTMDSGMGGAGGRGGMRGSFGGQTQQDGTGSWEGPDGTTQLPDGSAPENGVTPWQGGEAPQDGTMPQMPQGGMRPGMRRGMGPNGMMPGGSAPQDAQMPGGRIPQNGQALEGNVPQDAQAPEAAQDAAPESTLSETGTV